MALCMLDLHVKRWEPAKRSKQAIMESVAAMIGVTTAQLERNAGSP